MLFILKNSLFPIFAQFYKITFELQIENKIL